MDTTVIIPTLAEQKRLTGIISAVESVRAASAQAVQILAVVNGNRRSKEVCDWLDKQNDVIVIDQPEGCLPLAHLNGRKRVETRYFCFLDDDDEFTSGALDKRKAALLEKPEVALVVTNGYAFDGQNKSICFDKFPTGTTSPLRSLLSQNWLHNCNHLFSSEKVPVEFFQDHHAFMEWKWFAFKLALQEVEIVFLPENTFIYNDTPQSLSKSDKHFDAEISLLRKMTSKCSDSGIKKILSGSLSSAFHCKSERELQNGRWLSALGYHLRSLFLSGGKRYLSFTRYFFKPKYIFSSSSD